MAIKVTWKNESGKVESLTASTGTIRAAKVDSSDNPTEKFYYEHNPTARAQLTERADEADNAVQMQNKIFIFLHLSAVQ